MGVLAGGLLVAGLIAPRSAPAGSLINTSSATVWKYLDDGQQPDPDWTKPDFNDTAWKSGPAPLGYGDPGLGTEVGWGTNAEQKSITTWFRYSFQKPKLKHRERLVLALCVDNGAVAYLNGKEAGRLNLPAGQLQPETLASHRLSDSDEGFYVRLPIEANALRAGRNVLAVEAHRYSPSSSSLFLDFGLKSVPPTNPAPVLRKSARRAVETYRREHYLGPDITLPEGFQDGGRAMKFDAKGHPTSEREILMVNRAQDAGLARLLAFARSAELRTLSPLERAQRLAGFIDQQTTPAGGSRWEEQIAEQLEREFANQAVLLGEWLNQGHAGLCRHRALLFKLLGDEAGLKTALIRGNYDNDANAHTWNELFPGGGRRLLVDIMLLRNQQTFPEVSSPEVAGHYFKADNTPWYARK